MKPPITGTLAEDFVVEEFVGRACGVVRRSNGDIGSGIFRFNKTCFSIPWIATRGPRQLRREGGEQEEHDVSDEDGEIKANEPRNSHHA